ncbi:hypothetical protein [Aggregatibacter actinomycetemcomitans]|uniref:hypothetical protein n=1 Tax=Aggregatibacter actinomycetemcomitans TaxID=714 RepID=UPI0001B9F566|nr:hypothetical protein [Aggregatibacter actinomycetemcomitans]AHN71081.1 hypothetical protein CF65_00514 [Aggregatibacter actinomycetemcomitans HK1651]KYK75976.1 hypothetical protein SA2149_03500 [Aggregatibacter actinomycetemcomitans serotype e str. SA2149]KYK82269.1 hypothetical protein SC383S_00540 [Aggregatibacter actinomycetemcomitans SC383s]MBN6059170.1 hypothetical protein [Aggregatibacter actinomycetemcomitans]MBN6087671.1 hypothetical protein [Aggregatibacter actinomycetemcomitans]
MKKKNIWQYNKDNQSNEPVSLLFIASEKKSAVGILGVSHRKNTGKIHRTF